MIGLLSAEAFSAARVTAQDRQAFEQLVLKHQKYVFNLAYRMTGNLEEAKDLAQEAFVRAFRGFGQFQQGTSFERWLYRIVSNLYIDACRKRGRRHEESLDAPVLTANGPMERVVPDNTNNPATIVEATHFDGEVQKALDRLPEQYRLAVILCDVQGFSYEEIARMLACSIGTVRSRIHRGRRMLRESLTGFATERNYVK